MTSDPEHVYGWVGKTYRNRTATQSYDPAPRIEGVEITDLPVFSDEGGDFCEITRFLSDGSLSRRPGYMPAQLSYSLMEPGAIKAWHLHRNQDDLWFIPPGPRIVVGLLDVRESSATYQTSMRLTCGIGKGRLLHIPRGVAHGTSNPGRQAALLIYLVNRAFDIQNPDEHRLPYDLLGGDFWTIRPG